MLKMIFCEFWENRNSTMMRWLIMFLTDNWLPANRRNVSAAPVCIPMIILVLLTSPGGVFYTVFCRTSPRAGCHWSCSCGPGEWAACHGSRPPSLVPVAVTSDSMLFATLIPTSRRMSRLSISCHDTVARDVRHDRVLGDQQQSSCTVGTVTSPPVT